MKPRVEIWLDFASTYSALAAARAPAIAQSLGAEVVWKPFLLGPIFAAQGYNTSPILKTPDKARHMWRDLQRSAALYKLDWEYKRPSSFPQNSVTACRVGLIASDQQWFERFAACVYKLQFHEGKDIGQKSVILEAIAAAGQSSPDSVLAAAEAPANKERLKRQVAEAQQLGVFGAPTFIVGNARDTPKLEAPAGAQPASERAYDGYELFWGNDRLEQAFKWAKDGPWC